MMWAMLYEGYEVSNTGLVGVAYQTIAAVASGQNWGCENAD